jgi:hypothetical protein
MTEYNINKVGPGKKVVKNNNKKGSPKKNKI